MEGLQSFFIISRYSMILTRAGKHLLKLIISLLVDFLFFLCVPNRLFFFFNKKLENLN